MPKTFRIEPVRTPDAPEHVTKRGFVWIDLKLSDFRAQLDHYGLIMLVFLVVTTAGVSEIKARLSEYLARVRGGEEVVVTDRGRPVARIVPVSDREPHLEELERRGLIRRPSAGLPTDFLDQPRPRLTEGSSLVDAVIEERREGR